MEIFNYIGAFGMGGIIVKLLDGFWLQRVVANKERVAWLREKRFVAYTELTKELLSFGLHRREPFNPFESMANLAESMLLIENDALSGKIKSFIVRVDKLRNTPKVEAEKDYRVLTEEAGEIIKALKNGLVSS